MYYIKTNKYTLTSNCYVDIFWFNLQFHGYIKRNLYSHILSIDRLGNDKQSLSVKIFFVCSKVIEKIKQQDGNVSSIKKFYSFLINYYTNVFSSLSGTVGSNKKSKYWHT